MVLEIAKKRLIRALEVMEKVRLAKALGTCLCLTPSCWDHSCGQHTWFLGTLGIELKSRLYRKYFIE